MSADLYLSEERYLAALERQRARISGGLAFRKADSDAMGDKFTSAAWGLCSIDPEAWPEPADMLFPQQHPARVAPKYRNAPHKCPMDKREGAEIGGSGCLFTCAIFKTKRVKAADRHKAVSLYDREIAHSKARLGIEEAA